MKKPYLKFLGTIGPDDCKIYLVDGPWVRDNLYTDWVLGGHYYRYKWTPENEIWVEDMKQQYDSCFNLFHEIYERLLMKIMKLNYEQAHEMAFTAESMMRRLQSTSSTEASYPDPLGFTKKFSELLDLYR